MLTQDLIVEALVDIGELMPGESLAPEDGNKGLTTLNEILDALSIERLGVFGWQWQTFPLAAGTGGPGSPYTLGPGGSMNGTRPVEIRSAVIVASFTSVNGLSIPTNIAKTLRFPIPVLPVDAYAAVSQKDMQALFPEKMFNDGAFPLSNVYFHPVPALNGLISVDLFSWLALTQFATLTTPFSMPPGYQMALRKLLAVNLCSSYGRTPPQDLVALANDFKGRLGDLNRPPVPGAMEEALLAQPPQPAMPPQQPQQR